MAKTEIVTNVSVLNQKSEPCDLQQDNVTQIAIDLCESIDSGVGLAAPQIGIFKRIFIAKLSSGCYAFINPVLEFKGQESFPSTEGCLSVPGVVRCVERATQVEVKADQIWLFKEEDQAVTIIPGSLKFYGRDSCIVQHEQDHLDGILFTDRAVTLTEEERYVKRQQDRMNKIKAKRQNKKNKTSPQKTAKKPQSKTEYLKSKKQARRQRQSDSERLAIFEKFMAVKNGLFDIDSSEPSSSPEHADNTPVEDMSKNTDQGT